MTFVVQLLSRVQLFVTPWTAAHQAPLSFTISQSLLKLVSIESMTPSNHLILYHPLLFLPSIFPSIRIFSNESALCIRWPKYWSFSFNISPSNEYSGLISFRIHWFDPFAVQGTLKSLLQTIWKHQFFSAQPSLWFSFHIHTWLWHKLPHPEKWPQRKGTSRPELKIDCYLNQSGWHWSDHCMTDFKTTVRADCAVSVCSLPSSIKALVHWLLIVGGDKSSFRQKSSAPCLLASKIKQTFLSTSLASLLVFE